MSQSEPQSCEQLVGVARRILDSALVSAEEKLVLLELYSNTFDQLIVSDAFAQLSPERLKELNAMHERVLQFAQSLEGNLIHEMAHLRRKGQGLVKYLDVLPKRVSARNVKKG
ncbi:MAG: hypothetical protein ACO3XO_04700 [Bdellovibrionota bacterium]|jgi:hypothetical protein